MKLYDIEEILTATPFLSTKASYEFMTNDQLEIAARVAKEAQARSAAAGFKIKVIINDVKDDRTKQSDWFWSYDVIADEKMTDEQQDFDKVFGIK